MPKLIALAVCDDSTHMLVSPVVDAEKEDNEYDIAASILDRVEKNIKSRVAGVKSFSTDYLDYIVPFDGSKRPALKAEIYVSSNLVDNTKGISAHIWIYVVNDNLIDKSDYVIANFDAKEYKYPYKLKIWFSSADKIKRHLMIFRLRLVSQIKYGCKEHSRFKFGELPDYKNYGLIIYDPRMYKATQAVKGRIYSAQLKK